MRQLLGRGAALALAIEDWERRGLWVISRGHPSYPGRWRTALGSATPPLLYGAGERALVADGHRRVAIVGSRNANEAGLSCARQVAQACAAAGRTVVSGGARGVDSAAEQAALDAGGTVVSVLPASLQREAVRALHRGPLSQGRLALITPTPPPTGFSAGAALGRNPLIYALADSAVVPDASKDKGGTWAGATAALKRGAPPVYVRLGADAPAGNAALVELGALPLTDDGLTEDGLTAQALVDSAACPAPVVGDQLGLFEGS